VKAWHVYVLSGTYLTDYLPLYDGVGFVDEDQASLSATVNDV
jgi:hypothetical protein